ncbi:isoprenylcysteine carboxylmethyltransferase family protein [Pseudomonas stutzeri]|uniref:methyltransferase family protein n=1 Tax=Stutzerimonas stutzeri TaxID=316 RepID=UPI002109178B|nr:isoprenylcysteine carboxylmethyltransferase family protein [Stutzerimonas stutzeri]MCQ4313696.1 isoprenylcysteine carboxylmethyltransferase family protein [Stutzerimonas stutzeri]
MSLIPSGVILPPPLVYLSFVACAWGLTKWVPLDLPQYGLLPFIGWGSIAAGIFLMVWAALEMYRHRTTINPYGKPSSLLQTGPFRFSRNPIYLADTLIYCGIALLLDSLWPWLLLPLLILCMQRTVIVHEEHLLTRLFGDDYRAYRRHVRRWF